MVSKGNRKEPELRSPILRNSLCFCSPCSHSSSVRSEATHIARLSFAHGLSTGISPGYIGRKRQVEPEVALILFLEAPVAEILLG